MENKKLKIAFLSFYSGEVYRGVETFVHNLSNELTKNGHKITVFQNGPKLSHSLYETISINLKVDWSQKGTEGKRAILPDYWAKLIGRFTRTTLTKIDPQIDIILPMNGSLQSLYTRLWAIRHGVKMVISAQSGPGWDDRWNLLMFPSVFVATSMYHKQWAKQTNPFVKVTKVSNGVDYDKFAKSKSKIKLNLPKPIVLSVGALVPIKRHHLTIEAVSKIGASLVIAGKGDLKGELQMRGDVLLPNRFKIISVPYDKIQALYRSADVFAFPTSPWESFGMAMIEAMSCDLAVVATKDPIRAEIVGKAGILVNPQNTSEYAQALETALGKSWGNVPRLQAKKFSWDKIASQYEEIFYTIAK